MEYSPIGAVKLELTNCCSDRLKNRQLSNCPKCLFSAPLCHIQTRSPLVKGRSPETNLLLDDSMLTFTRLLAIHCTDECFNYKLTHFELHLFIATIRSRGWNILFILKRGDQPVDDMQAEIPKTKILC